MDLIDRNKLSIVSIDTTDLIDQKNVVAVLYDDILNADVVEAIPVAYLKQKYNDKARYATDSYKAKAKLIREILKEWRNGND